MTEEESGFTFVDKRRVPEDAGDVASEDASTSPSPNADSSAETDTPQDTSAAPPLPRLTVRDRLLMCIDILHQGAWISMGLVTDPATGKIEKDMAQAQIAIDSVAFLADKVEEMLDEQTRRELKNLLSDLRINYVQQRNR
jgi:hypothetical protein